MGCVDPGYRSTPQCMTGAAQIPWPSLTSKLQGTALLRAIPSVEHPPREAWFSPRRTEMVPHSPPSAGSRPQVSARRVREGAEEAAAALKIN
jgi:hypothetical protein